MLIPSLNFGSICIRNEKKVDLQYKDIPLTVNCFVSIWGVMAGGKGAMAPPIFLKSSDFRKS